VTRDVLPIVSDYAERINKRTHAICRDCLPQDCRKMRASFARESARTRKLRASFGGIAATGEIVAFVAPIDASMQRKQKNTRREAGCL
jgi:hypothetical protein